MLVTKRKPKLNLENDLKKNKMQFCTDFSQNYPKDSSTIALPWQQWMSHGIGLYSELKHIVKVTKFELPTAYRFSTAEGRNSLWGIPTPFLFKIELDPLKVNLENSKLQLWKTIRTICES